MKQSPVFLICLLFTQCTSSILSQQVINKTYTAKGNIHLTEDIAIPKINPGYTLWLPTTGKSQGMIVFTHPRRDTIHSDALIDYALDKQLAVLYATTENRLEFFFEKEKMLEIERYLQEVISAYNIPKDNLLFCGMSLEGTRALKLAIFAQTKNSKHQIIPKAMAICDAPLDMIRFHKEMVKAKKLNFHPTTANEGTWVSGYLEKKLGGPPTEMWEAYVQYSPYTYFDRKGTQHLPALKDIAIRAYTEPDVQWWMTTRRKDYYSMNAIDLAALINELHILGNEKAELILTQNKGYQPDGTRHPHSWSIVDEQELVDWFVEMLAK